MNDIVAVAGSMGGLIGLRENDKEFLRKLFTGRIEYREFHQRMMEMQKPVVASLVINNMCNMKCRHCYLQFDNNSGKDLELSEWNKVIRSIASMSPELISFSGKEVLFDPKGPDMLLNLRDIKDSNHGAYRIGFITNGTLLHRHQETVLEMNPDYLDISLDGIEQDHDAIRGSGAFSKTIPNVEWAAETLKERFFVSMVIQSLNAPHLIEIVESLYHRGVRNLAFSFYKQQPYTDASFALSDIETNRVFADLNKLKYLDLQDTMKIMLDLDIYFLPALLSFIKSDGFDIDDIKEDSNGNLFIETELNEHVSLWFRLNILPPGISRFRITSEGNLLAAGDTLNTERYAKFTIGNVRDFEYDFKALYNYALSSDRLNIIFQDYYNKILPLIVKEVKAGLSGEKSYEYTAA